MYSIHRRNAGASLVEINKLVIRKPSVMYKIMQALKGCDENEKFRKMTAA